MPFWSWGDYLPSGMLSRRHPRSGRLFYFKEGATMPLNKQKGNMYPWVTHTWNPIRGKCPHDCVYCYMKGRFDVGDLRLAESELDKNHGKGRTIFVGSATDMFANGVSRQWVFRVLEHCIKYDQNS